MATPAIFKAGDYIETQPDTLEAAKSIGTWNSSQWCTPIDPQSPISDFAVSVNNSTYTIGTTLRDVAIRAELEMEDIKHGFEQLGDFVRNADATLEDIKTYIAVAKVLVIFIDILVIALMIQCILAWMGEHHFIPKRVRKTVIIPIFVALVIIFWIFSTLILSGAMVGSDFCSTPDESVISLITGFQGQLSPSVSMLMMYYVTVSLIDTMHVISVDMSERYPDLLSLFSQGLLARETASPIGNFILGSLFPRWGLTLPTSYS